MPSPTSTDRPERPALGIRNRLLLLMALPCAAVLAWWPADYLMVRERTFILREQRQIDDLARAVLALVTVSNDVARNPQLTRARQQLMVGAKSIEALVQGSATASGTSPALRGIHHDVRTIVRLIRTMNPGQEETADPAAADTLAQIVLTSQAVLDSLHRSSGDHQRALAAAWERRRHMSFAIFFGLLVLTVGLHVTTRSLARRLTKLQAGALRLAQGDLSQRIPAAGSDEIAVVTAAFNTLAERISIQIDSLRGSEEMTAKVIEMAPEAMMVVDSDGRMTRVNVRLEQIFGYRRAELIGRPVEMLVPVGARDHHRRLRRDYLADSPAQRVMGKGRELFGLRKDGGEFPIEISLGPLQMGSDQFVVTTIADITQRKHADEALAESARRLARSNADLEQFAYAASHDLQEPLRSIGGMLQLLRKRYGGQLDEKADTFIDHAVKGAERMQRLIDDLLTFSRAGTRDEPFRPVDCNEVVEQTVQALSAAIEESGAKVRWAKLPVVDANRTQMHQLFQNLIGNAVKFRGERTPEISISARRNPNGSGWRFSVADNGIGIAPQFREDVFKVFRRLHTRRQYQGTGIGLALCRRIVERHGGRIWVESEPGQGSAFTFDLGAGQFAENGQEADTHVTPRATDRCAAGGGR